MITYHTVLSVQAVGVALMGLGGYILAQSRNWQEIVQAPDSGAVLVCVVGAATFLVAFFGCCGASQESGCMLQTYAVVVGLVFVVEIAAAILLLVYTTEVSLQECHHVLVIHLLASLY